MSIAFIPKSLASRFASLPVFSIYACAYGPTVLSESSGFNTRQKTNHWVFYMAISENESLRLDPSPDSKGKLTLIVSEKNYLHSHNTVKTVKLSTVEHLTAGNVIEYLRSSKYIEYKFSSGQGCRYWIESVVSLLSSAGYITAGSQIEEAKGALQFVWDAHGKVGETEQSGIIPGEFYMVGGGGASSKGSSSAEGWSEWTWRQQYNCYERYRYDHNGEAVYDYSDPQK